MNEEHMASEEEALRGLLRGAVEGLEPSADALERLRCAVPARRSRNRRAVVGAAAAVLLAGAAVPAALHLAAAPGAGPDRSTMAGHGETRAGADAGTSDPHQNGSGSQPRPTERTGRGSGGGAPADAPPPVPSGDPAASTGADSAVPGGGSAAGSGAGLLPPPAAPGVPGCSAEQLGVSASALPPAADGKVYGSFKVTNVSPRGCTVLGPDAVTAAPASGPAPGQGGTAVAVVTHTAGDPAVLLPDPSKEAPLMLLAPKAAYEVRFAYVPPAQACTATGASPGGLQPQGGVAQAPMDASGADPDGSGSSTGTGSGGGTGATTPPSPSGPGVEVSHTPSTPLPGAATTRTTIPDACGGTVYRTGVLPADTPPGP
ncbi:hypothetical protein [Streptomyces sp. NPDC091268]|uniref:hypothetical protein n=1 Tax=Streptomyces sp. NPDC091268 TaxID=3365979 RepID=UPI00382AEDD9